MILYEKSLIDFTEVNESEINEGLQNGTITNTERLKEHHTIPEEEKRAGKTAEEIFYELKAQGIPVGIHNGIYCKIIFNTYEAINPISSIDDWDEYEEVFVKNN